jgi:hypothetical protein
VDTVLSATQVGTYCKQVSKFAGSGLSKLFLTAGLHTQPNANANPSS